MIIANVPAGVVPKSSDTTPHRDSDTTPQGHQHHPPGTPTPAPRDTDTGPQGHRRRPPGTPTPPPRDASTTPKESVTTCPWGVVSVSLGACVGVSGGWYQSSCGVVLVFLRGRSWRPHRPRITDQSPGTRAKGQEPRTSKDQGLGTKDQGPRLSYSYPQNSGGHQKLINLIQKRL